MVPLGQMLYGTTKISKSLRCLPTSCVSSYPAKFAVSFHTPARIENVAVFLTRYRDGRNPTFWCSIGVLYYQINQYRDALDAYSRAIRLNPYLSEVWYVVLHSFNHAPFQP